ncbi:MAG: TetR/AcrR family transcriptional regulator [Parvibaculum sp.]|uniref:TetR/AcrR family transcriptional regulator n=1 Tax=Parvibaculum sp. TaxID=2024848 RepID=UPI0025EFD0FD|nr:TetR/AcrR family transcriptional regulator [Parvibaculum sp.]MCE9650883.1 TetR/AcrR family transcriptional regulator [Parvibaculum sp.]
MRGDDTKDRIKLAAKRLFAERGVDGVSIREIVSAAGQRNVGSLHYYFRTKEALVRELIVDGVRHIDDRRNVMLDELEKKGGPKVLREVVDILIMPAMGNKGTGEDDDTYFRFFLMLQLNHRQLFIDALGEQKHSGYERCVAHIKQLLPDVPAALLQQRMFFAALYISTALAARESSAGGEGGRHPFWTLDYTMSNLADTVQALLECKASTQTTAALTPAQFSKRGRRTMRLANAQ